MTWLERKPRVSLEPSLIPSIPVMFVSGFVALYALVHVLNLLGFQTGR
jgi:hypothetical protein